MKNFFLTLFSVYFTLLKASSYEEFRKFYQDDPVTLSKFRYKKEFDSLLINGKKFRFIEKAVENYVQQLPKCPVFDHFGDNTLLIVTDMQKAFGTNGPVQVPGAEKSVWPINKAKPMFDYVIHTLDTHLEWSKSFSINPDYKETFYPHARTGTDDFQQFEGLDICADAYFGKEQFFVTTNPKFKMFVMKKKITRIVFTGVAGELCVNAGILGVLEDPDLAHINIGLYKPGVQWVFPEFISNQRNVLEKFKKFGWLETESDLIDYLQKY